MKELFTGIKTEKASVPLSPADRTMVLGSCFADSIGERMKAGGFDVCVNPFGTLYNPASLAAAVSRLDSGVPFTPEECVRMGSGSDLVCSFSHHTSFARPTEEEFLAAANASLERASEFWRGCDAVIITLGTARVWRRADTGEVVSNCLKRPGTEFTNGMLSLAEVTSFLKEITDSHSGKRFIFTVSPIRHLGLGARDNTLSKATLHLALNGLQDDCSQVCYFPAYEILTDELRDYRFYAEDLVHPAKIAVDIIWERFLDTFVPDSFRREISDNEKAARRLAHRPMR